MTRAIPDDELRKIPGAIRFYSVFAYVTGVFLLLLVAEMIIKYVPWGDGYGYEVFFGGGQGLHLVPAIPEFTESALGVNLSIGVLIVHGWLYVVYLIADFRLWSLLRWPFSRFIVIALGGVVPFLSFIVEHFMSRRARADLAAHQARAERTRAQRQAWTANPSSDASNPSPSQKKEHPSA